MAGNMDLSFVNASRVVRGKGGDRGEEGLTGSGQLLEEEINFTP
jgi:hypothetical protein